MIYRAAFWLIFVLLVSLLVYGLAAEQLFEQPIWAAEGLYRLAWFGGAYILWTVAFLLVRRDWFVPATLVAALAGALIVAGMQATLGVLFLFASAWALGRLCALEGALALLAGLAAVAFFTGMAVLLPVNYPLVYAAALLIPLVRERRSLLSIPCKAGQWLSAASMPMAGWTGAAALGFVLLMHLAVVLGPEVSADGLAMHLAIPTSIHYHHQWILNPRETSWAVFPMAGDWGFTAAYLLGGEAAARLFNFGMLLAAAGLVFKLARRMLETAPALLVTALFVSSPMTQLVTGSLFVENFWAVMLTGAAEALVRYTEDGRKRHALAAAALLGTALAAKFGTLAYLPPILLLLLLQMRRRRSLALAPVCAAMLLVAGLPPYLKAWVQTGNPVFPFLNHIFRSPYFDSAAPFVDTRFPPPAPARALYDLTFKTRQHFEGQNGGWTFFCFLFAPLGLLLLRPGRSAAGWTVLAIALPASVLTLASQGNVRYLYPALPLCAVVAAGCLRELHNRCPSCYRASLTAAAAVLALQVYFLPASGGYHKQFFVFGKPHREAYLAACAPGRRIVAWLNRTHPGEPVAFIETNQIAGLKGRALTASWHHYPFYSRLMQAGSPAKCREFMLSQRIRLMVAPADLNQVIRVALRRMLARFTDPVYEYAGWQVRTFRNQAPEAPPPPYSILFRGTYDDLDSQIEFSGRWDSGRFGAASGGSVTYSNHPGDWFCALFEGSGITWVYTKAFNRGLAEVRVDGRVVDRLDLYSKETLWRSCSRFEGFRAGPHVLEVTVLGQRNPAATDCFVDLDELRVE